MEKISKLYRALSRHLMTAPIIYQTFLVVSLSCILAKENKKTKEIKRDQMQICVVFYVVHKIRKRLLNSSQSGDIYAVLVWCKAPHLDKK